MTGNPSKEAINRIRLADIGLQNAVAMHYNDGARIPVAQLREFAAMWTPWRSVATWYLWRSLDPIPVEY